MKTFKRSTFKRYFRRSQLEDNSAFVGLIVVIVALVLSACGGRADAAAAQQVPGGDPERGQQLLQAYGCQACHTIPGVTGANATVGPPLTDWANRHYIAGNLPNTPDNLIRWLRQPQEIEPGTAMPDLGVTEQDAQDISAFLYTLR